MLAASYPDLRLALVGEGPAEVAIRERANRSGLVQHLLLPGARPAAEIALWLNAADVVCLASHGEGCPNVVIEALCCGRPVVGAHVGGIPELIVEGCGLLAPARNPSAFARAISQALETVWEPHSIAVRFSRSWEDVARETLAICLTCLPHSGVK
jgi:glycosyltransferase involved in cell wall biosynthesis